MTSLPADSTPVSQDIKPAGGINLTPAYLYLGGYVVLIIIWVIGTLTGSVTKTPSKWKEMAYPNWNTQDDTGAPNASFIKLWDDITFTSVDGNPIKVNAGDRLTEQQSLMLARAISHDESISTQTTAGSKAKKLFPYNNITFYADSWYAEVPWPFVFTFYNMIGLFSALYLGLKGPVSSMLADNVETTKEQLAQARLAKQEAEGIRADFGKLAHEVAAEKARLAELAKEEQALERTRILDQAKHDAEGLVDSVRNSIDVEKSRMVTKTKQRVVLAALDKARVSLVEQMPEYDDAVMQSVTADISNLELKHD